MRVPCLTRNELSTCLSKHKPHKLYTTSFFVTYQTHDQFKATISVQKSFGKAHDRNKVRRRIYSCIHSLNLKAHIWFRISKVHQGFTQFAQIQQAILFIKRKITLTKN